VTTKDLFGNDVPEPDEYGYLAKKDKETQLEAMRKWFFQHFQSPADETPYDSEEGGYVYLYGGPYEAKEELDARFGALVPDEVIEELAEDLGGESYEWEGRPRPGDYDDYVLNAIAPASEHAARFNAGIENIRKLVKTSVDPSEQQLFLRLLFSAVITTMETYLSDRFLSSITRNPRALRKFVETFPRFQKEPLNLCDIFKKSEDLETRIRLMLVGEIIWHRLVMVKDMFKDTFDVLFPESDDMGRLLRAIDIRHDLIHRSGRSKDGVEHTITVQGIERLIEDANQFAHLIEGQNGKFLGEEIPI
jgi:hypothetical protein